MFNDLLGVIYSLTKFRKAQNINLFCQKILNIKIKIKKLKWNLEKICFEKLPEKCTIAQLVLCLYNNLVSSNVVFSI